MMENELKRIADALEAIAIALQPPALTVGTSAAVDVPGEQPTPCTPVDPKPAKKEKAAKKQAPVVEDEAPASEPPTKQYTQEEIIEAVQRAVKVNRDATLAICRKYGYEKSLKDIAETVYSDLSKDLEGVK